MKILLIARREIYGFLVSPLGYIIIAAILCLHGVWFNAVVMQTPATPFKGVENFFFHSSGFVAAFCALTSMRLFAEEQQTGTLLLLQSSPASEWEVVLGKYTGGMAFVLLYLVFTTVIPMPLFLSESVSIGHILTGYAGLILLAMAVMSVGLFASSLTGNQLVAAVMAGVMIIALFTCWLIARKLSGSLADFVGYLDLMDRHFRTFSRGTIASSTVVYYLSLAYMGILLSVSVLFAKRWRG